MASYSDNDRPLILAHRGGAAEAPENSLEAFRHSVKLGVKHLETDIRAASDGTLYLTHGATSILPNQPLQLHEDIPATLPELFDAFPYAFFAIDPKHELAVEPLAKLVSERNMQDRVCIGSSFDRRTEQVAARVEQLSGKRPLTALVSAKAVANLLIGLKNPNVIQASYIHVPGKLVTKATVNTAHRWNLKIIAWVLNDRSAIRRALDIGVDGFMTDYPTLAMKVVHEK